MKKKALLISPPKKIKYFRNYFKGFGNNLEIIEENYLVFKKKLPNFTAVVRIPTSFIKKEIFSITDQLEWVHFASAGIEDILIPEIVKSDILLTNGKILQGPEIADHAIALCLSLTRQIKSSILKKKNIKRPIELNGKNVLVYGLGGVGSLIAERIKSFNCNVIGIDNELKPYNSYIDQIYRPDKLFQILERIDIIFVCSPLTPQTKFIFSLKEFNKMKKKPYLINVARGKIIDTRSLVKALRLNKLSGVGLDVTYPEPLKKNHYLYNHNNVIITPHTAGMSENNRERSHSLIKENLKRYFKNKSLLNEVNKLKGY